MYIAADRDRTFLSYTIVSLVQRAAKTGFLSLRLAAHWTRPVILLGPKVDHQKKAVRLFGRFNEAPYSVTKALYVILRQLLAVHQALYPAI